MPTGGETNSRVGRAGAATEDGAAVVLWGKEKRNEEEKGILLDFNKPLYSGDKCHH